MDFARNGGFVAALEQCNGQGVCRKDTGVMCPSFQATRDEKYSTRGRANLLRSMIKVGASGRETDYGKTELSQVVFDALDLCLACKGCKAECPSGVDMAKLKFAFQAEYYKKHPRLLRDYLFGYFHVTARLLSSIAPLVNFGMGIGLMRRFMARVMKITPNRPFPKFSQRGAKVRSLPGHQKVFFLRDPFTQNVEPNIEQAAFDILFAMGFDVEVLAIVGAGASLLSKGFISAARNHARRLLDELKKQRSG